MQSCVDSLPIPTSETTAKIVFQSDISTSEKFRAKISTSTGLDQFHEFTHPEDLDVRITWNTDEFVKLIYQKSCNCYESSFEKPISGRLYNLDAYVIDNELYDDIFAQMMIPRTTTVDTFRGTLSTIADKKYMVQSQLTLDTQNKPNQFYHIIPYRKVTESYLDQLGNVQYKFTGEIEYLELFDFHNNEIYLEELYNQPGFLVDFNEQVPSAYALRLDLLHVADIELSGEGFEKIYFEIRTVTESYYRYNLYQSRKLNSFEHGNVEPPISFTNIKGGLGYFGGYSVVQDSFLLQ